MRLALLWLGAWCGPSAAPEFRALFTVWGDNDWQRLLHLADAETLLCVSVECIDKGQLGCTDDARRNVQTRYLTRRRWNGILASAAVDIWNKLTTQGVSSRLLKGAALSTAVYGAADLRDTRDIDLLVPRAQLFQAAQIISEAGYRCQVDLAWLQQPLFVNTRREISFHSLGGAIEIDLHWRLSNRWLASPTPDEELLARANHDICMGGRHVLWFASPDWLALARSNILNSNTVELKAVVDLIRCAHAVGTHPALTSPFVHGADNGTSNTVAWLQHGTIQVLRASAETSRLPVRVVARDLLAPSDSARARPLQPWIRHMLRLRSARQASALLKTAFSPTIADYMTAHSVKPDSILRKSIVNKIKRRG